MNIGNIIHKRLRTKYYNKIFMLGSAKEIHQYKNYFNVKKIMYANGSHPVSSINISTTIIIE